MNLGELIFQLGFKTTGTNEVDAMNSAVNAADNNFSNLQKSLRSVAVELQKVAGAMGGMNQSEKRGNDEKQKSAGLLGTLQGKLKSYLGSVNAARLTIMAGAGALTYFTNNAAKSAIELDKTATLTGISAQTLQRLGDMAAQTGANVNDLTGAIASFQKNSVDIMLGRGGNIGVFQFLGIDPHQDPIKILDQVSKKLKTMPTALGTTLAKDLGLSDDLIYFLKNAENLKPVSDETILTDKEIKRLKDFSFNFNRVFEMSKRSMQKFAAAITPLVNMLVYGFERFSSMFSGILNYMEPFFDKMKKFMPVVATLAGILFAAFFPVTAAVLALGLAFEDLYSFVKGDDSLFGRMVNWLKDVDKVIRTVIDSIMFLGNALTFGIFEKELSAFSFRLSDMLGNAFTAPMAPMAAGAGGGSFITNQSVNINIDGAKDPKAIGSEIQNHLKKEISNAHNNLDRGRNY